MNRTAWLLLICLQLPKRDPVRARAAKILAARLAKQARAAMVLRHRLS
jgi:hypothetical protein